ncbi:hypothetical protein PIB30_094750, partial [Stylosanthes scabra]|nr:hypothetical protein [Stylosanthes scabra]
SLPFHQACLRPTTIAVQLPPSPKPTPTTTVTHHHCSHLSLKPILPCPPYSTRRKEKDLKLEYAASVHHFKQVSVGKEPQSEAPLRWGRKPSQPLLLALTALLNTILGPPLSYISLPVSIIAGGLLILFPTIPLLTLSSFPG